MRVPILTYHANNVAGIEYADNDHVALAEDLRMIHRAGLRIVPLARVVDALLGLAPESSAVDAVAISFDDGSWLDWHDVEHPAFGPQRGLAGVLRDFQAETGATVHATSFVIVSPEARAELDRTCLAGHGWWGHDWWCPALREGLLAIESHSWDHNHDTLAPVGDMSRKRGTFRSIDDHAAADLQIRKAADWLDAHLAPHRASLFAYPYGETNEYLTGEYLPRFTHEHRVRAAFGTEPAPVTRSSDRWNLPRYICGQHWRSPQELGRILRG